MEPKEVDSMNFQTIYDFAKTYTNDRFLLELIAIDYYSFHKSKPKDLFEIEQKVEEDLRELASHQKSKFVSIQISFNYQIWKEENRIEETAENWLIEFVGTSHHIIHSKVLQ